MIRSGHNDPSKYKCWELFRATLKSKTETKVLDITKGGSEGKNAVVSELKPNSDDWERTVYGKQWST